MKLLPIYIVASLLLAGCNLYKDYNRPEGLAAEALGAFPAAESSDSMPSLGSIPWSELFTDADLRALISEGLDSNRDLRVAMLRVDQASASLSAAKLAFLPLLTFSPNGAITSVDGGRASKTFEIPVSMSWEIDLFGKLRNARKEQQMMLLASQAYASAVRSELVASIATGYYALLMLDSQIEISARTIDVWSEQVRAMESQRRVGAIRENALSQAKANLEGLRAAANTLERQRREAENSLCSLIGVPSHPIRRSSLDAQSVPERVSAGIPLRLLSCRPDVVRAEMNLAAAGYAVNQARGAFYPSLTIGGSAGWTNSLGQAVSNPGSWILSALGSLTQPLFQRGKLTSNLKISKDEERIALLDYRQTLLDAGKEVNDALYAIESYGNDYAFHEAQCAALEKTVKANELLFRTNNATYLELLASRQDLLNSRLNLVVDKVGRLRSVVELYKALGGGAE